MRKFTESLMPAVYVFCLTRGGFVAAQNAEEQNLAALNRALDAGVPTFVRQVKADRLAPPLIYSDWYVAELVKTQPDRAPVERQKRQFGRRLLEVLDETSEEILALSDSASRERAATTLLDLADWIAGRRGYGNMFIFNRCQDMATVPLAHLVADLNYPAAKVDALVSRLVSTEDRVRMCAEALNTELPEPVFVPGTGPTLDAVQEPVQRTWAKGVRRILSWCRETGRMKLIPPGKARRAALPAELAFYCDDGPGDTPKPRTTLNKWDGKHHEQLVVGLGSVNLPNLRSFLLFRKKVGRFPTQAPSWWKPGDAVFPTPETAAFDMAWEPFRREFGPVYGTAAGVYTSVTANAFFDADTELKGFQEIDRLAAAGALERGPNGRSRSKDPRIHVGPRGEITFVGPFTPNPTTRSSGVSAWIELPGTRPASQPATQAATQPAGK